MRIVVAMILVQVLGGCGGSSRERVYCERQVKLCEIDSVTEQDLAQCVSELPEVKAQVGAEAYDRFLGCTLEASSCEALAGCLSGAMATVGEQAAGELERGFVKPQPPLR